MGKVTVTLMSGQPVLEALEVDAPTTVRDIKRVIETQNGTPASRQLLILDCDVLGDTTILAELHEDLSLRLVCKQSIAFDWYLNRVLLKSKGSILSSEDFKLIGSELAAGSHCNLNISLHPDGLESPMRDPKCYSVLLETKPRTAVLNVRVTLGDVVRQKVFTTGMGMLGWLNFGPIKDLRCEEPRDKLTLEVLHCGVMETPYLDGDSLHWDLRSTLGGMPFPVGTPFVGNAEAMNGITLRLSFFPGGHNTAPADHTSLWVMPVVGLGALRYCCKVDGVEEWGDGESLLHFPRVEQYGNIQLTIPQESGSVEIVAPTVGIALGATAASSDPTHSNGDDSSASSSDPITDEPPRRGGGGRSGLLADIKSFAKN